MQLIVTTQTNYHRRSPRQILTGIAAVRLLAVVGLFLLSTCSFEVNADSTTRPNIVLILADDMGYSDIGCYGGEIETPNLDALAAGGLRFVQFYNTARCCPTRAALLTGLHQHQTGIGQMTETPKGPRNDDRPAYQGFLNRRCVTIAEVLGASGYHTYMTGKWHLGFHGQEKWPLQRGFEKFYGAIAGATSYFRPSGGRGITLGNQNLDPPTDPDYYTTDAFTDYALEFLQDQTDDAPFFLYLAYTAPHWPLHAREQDIQKYVGKYREIGWDRLREQRLATQKELGIVAENVALPERDAGVRDWNDLNSTQKDQLDYRMAVYAAMVDRMDQNIGRVVELLKKQGKFEDTLILFLSDNGGCAEPYRDLGGGKFKDINNPSVSGAVSYGQGWANASNTPFRKFKVFSHEGGIATPLIVHWPNGLKVKSGSITDTPAQLIDLMPTVLDVTGASYPTRFADHAIQPLEGTSLLSVLRDEPHSPADWMFWEHAGHAAVRNGDFKALRPKGTKQWQLYNLLNDRQEQVDLSNERRDQTEMMAGKWQRWADRVGVSPSTPSRSAQPPVKRRSEDSIPSSVADEPGDPASAKGRASSSDQVSSDDQVSSRALDRPNILLIITDDQNDYFSDASGVTVVTPTLDQLERQSISFPRAYCASPVCGPSRAALFSGLYPHHTGAYLNGSDPWRTSAQLQAADTLPELFQRGGYETWGMGKLFHAKLPSDRADRQWNHRASANGGFAPFGDEDHQLSGKFFSVQAWDGPDTDFPDVKSANKAIDFLRDRTSDEPFFMVYGLWRPHNPWTAPRRFFELYDPNEITFPPHGYRSTDLEDVPDAGRQLAAIYEQRWNRHGARNRDDWRRVMHGYLACTSFADWNMGCVIRALDRSKYADNTIVIVTSDNGYHVGEKSHFGKSTLWEQSARVPLLVRMPSGRNAGTTCNATVGLIDLYPTLQRLCGLPDPKQSLDGRDLCSLLGEPGTSWPYPAITTYGEERCSVRHGPWRYIVYPDGSEELYRHTTDPHEIHNLSQQPEYVDILETLRTWVPPTWVPSLGGRNG